MDKNLIKKDYKKKIKKLIKNNFFYFDKNKPIITDDEYDSLKKDILLLEKKYPFLKGN
jgi:DNA ligase (NAD+)